MWTWLSQSLSTKVPIQIFDILDYLQVEIKKNVNALKESMTKRLNENEFIENIENIKNTKNTVDDDLGNVESAANRL